MAGTASVAPNSPSARSSESPLSSSPPLKLLLHTSDGVVPYLTPTLLRQCFPPHQFPHLSLAMAVSETCVIPISSLLSSPSTISNDGNSSSLTSSDRTDATSTTTTELGVKRTKGGNKGYTFSKGSIHTDSWIQPYPRVTVPTLDSCRSSKTESRSPAVSPRVPRSNTNNTNASSSSNATVPSTTTNSRDKAVMATDRHVMVRTPHGRLALSLDDYLLAAKGLDSQSLIPLYDVPPLPSSTSDLTSKKDRGISLKRIKRLETANRRSLRWYEQCCTSDSERQGSSVFAPILVDSNGTPVEDLPNTSETNNKSVEVPKESSFSPSDATTTASEVAETRQALVQNASHIVVLGWHHVQDSQNRRQCLSNVMQRQSTTSTQLLEVCVLAIESLQQFLDAAGSLSTIGKFKSTTNLLLGTDLPQQWARHHQAFVLELTTTTTTSESSTPSLLRNKRPQLMPNKQLTENGCIDLTPTNPPSDHPWYRDSNPLVLGCPCLACTSQNRAYLYHLVCANELLVEMMLFIHNLHHLLTLVGLINKEIYNNHTDMGERLATWEQWERHWMSQMNCRDGSE